MRKITYGMHPAEETMTVSDLRQALKEFPPDAPVLFTWEGIHVPVQPRCLSLDPTPFCDQAPVVWLNADQTHVD